MATWAIDIAQALATLGGVARLADIYEEVKKIRPRPPPKSVDAIIRGTIEQHSSDSAKFSGKDLFFSAKGIGSGVWGLRSAAKETPKAIDIDDPAGNETPGRVVQETYRVLRDTALARQLKLLHNNRCQICDETISLPNGELYSEAHHIKPLGRPHNGPDVAGNILVLCPNHHVMLDYGAIKLRAGAIRIHPNHRIGGQYVEYHNNRIYKQPANNRV
ncbi:MAG: HNH endonuclease [Chromatiales bacterium]|jgi:hypothetical protein|nr:HNH endonuclease [Chromatiales bacterium]